MQNFRIMPGRDLISFSNLFVFFFKWAHLLRRKNYCKSGNIRGNRVVRYKKTSTSWREGSGDGVEALHAAQDPLGKKPYVKLVSRINTQFRGE